MRLISRSTRIETRHEARRLVRLLSSSTVRQDKARAVDKGAANAGAAQQAQGRALSAAACSAQAGGLSDEPQEALPALTGREADGAPPWRPQAGDRDQGADAGSDDAERPVVARLCVGPAGRRPPLPHSDRRR